MVWKERSLCNIFNISESPNTAVTVIFISFYIGRSYCLVIVNGISGTKPEICSAFSQVH